MSRLHITQVVTLLHVSQLTFCIYCHVYGVTIDGVWIGT
jgi:hypothetical protein